MIIINLVNGSQLYFCFRTYIGSFDVSYFECLEISWETQQAVTNIFLICIYLDVIFEHRIEIGRRQRHADERHQWLYSENAAIRKTIL